ncbi:Na+/H+ antiporter NhaA [Brevundimonas sp. 2R-24]|uniref:Na(+)/H(+) antiporter NhaA n=1 Tax=Peiella sedimenti TaxID=3061083 RepID=A0ABT8SHL5_9CAUL|nr:Na+/H+ antiporter NhaA [Caulobacteraceae bacterium XZ-24]
MARRLTLDFFKTEAASGLFLAIAALSALVLANSPWADAYFGILKTDIPVRIGAWSLTENVSEWIKEGLMAIFFFVVGLEIKYEILRGELSNPKKLALPVLAAVGGMVGPALVYLGVTGALGGDPRGWSIPVATDIAFAVAAFALVASSLPASLRVFLLTLAIVDDLGAVAIIAAVYSDGVTLPPLLGAGVVLAALALIGRFQLSFVWWVLGFLLVWGFAMEAHISTSLAGVATALVVPINAPKPGVEGPLKNFMETLHPWVAYFILPLFAFSAAGFSFAGLSPLALFSPVALGIALGLFLGKQIGVMGLAWLACRLKLGVLPSNARWSEMYGVSLLCGVGFTMSLFLGALAFPGAPVEIETEVKLGVIAGSLLSGLVGMLVLSRAAAWRKRCREDDAVLDAA